MKKRNSNSFYLWFLLFIGILGLFNLFGPPMIQALQKQHSPSSLYKNVPNTSPENYSNRISSSLDQPSSDSLSIINPNNNNSTTTSSNNTQSCHPFLYQLGSFSRDNTTTAVARGSCPEAWSVFPISLFLLLFYILLFVVSLMGLFYKRKSGHVRARNPVFMILNMIACLICVLIICLRFVVGRNDYPCGIYLLTWFVLPSLICLPTIFKCLRLFMMYRLNLHKTKMMEMMKKSSATTTTQLEGKHDGAEEDHPVVEDSVSQINHNKQEHDPSTNPVMNQPTTQVSEEQIRASFEKKMKICSFVASYKLIVPTFFVVAVFNVMIFLILGGYEYSEMESNNKPIFSNGQGGLFVFNIGCRSSWSTAYVLISNVVLYLILEISALILLFFVERDTWFIKREVLIMVVIQIASSVTFFVCFSIPIVTSLVDYIVPYGLIWIVENCLETLINVTFPVIYAFIWDQRKTKIKQDLANHTCLTYFLSKKKTFNMFLDFCRRSFCVENILCYDMIQMYKKSSTIKNRKKLALDICETFLKPGAPLQLNWSNITKKYQEISSIVKAGVILEYSLFDEVLFVCLTNMTDAFERMKAHHVQVRNYLSEWMTAYDRSQHEFHV